MVGSLYPQEKGIPPIPIRLLSHVMLLYLLCLKTTTRYGRLVRPPQKYNPGTECASKWKDCRNHLTAGQFDKTTETLDNQIVNNAEEISSEMSVSGSDDTDSDATVLYSLYSEDDLTLEDGDGGEVRQDFLALVDHCLVALSNHSWKLRIDFSYGREFSPWFASVNSRCNRHRLRWRKRNCWW